MSEIEKDKILCTPEKYLDAIHAFFSPIDLDPCSNRFSSIRVINEYLLPHNDGLVDPWFGRVYVNSPWGYDFNDKGVIIIPWMQRCVNHFKSGGEVLAYVPYFPDARWYFSLVEEQASSICIVENSESYLWSAYGESSEKIPTSFVYYGKRIQSFKECFSNIGKVLWNL